MTMTTLTTRSRRRVILPLLRLLSLVVVVSSQVRQPHRQAQVYEELERIEEGSGDQRGGSKPSPTEAPHSPPETLPEDGAVEIPDPADFEANGGTKNFIVVYEDMGGIAEGASIAETEVMAMEVVENNGGVVNAQFDTVLNGMAASLTYEAYMELSQQPGIAYLEEDGIASIDATWGTDRIDQVNAPGNGVYVYENDLNAGSGVNVCVVDTGVNANNQQLKLVGGRNFENNADNNSFFDCNSHGTHVAGTVGSRSFGVAPGANIWAVKVLSCSGSGSFSWVISGINWCTQQKLNNPGSKWIINMSLGGAASVATDTAIRNARNNNIVVVVAAGNSQGDACNGSPAREPAAVTVGATTNMDQRPPFSNFGQCVDIFAPGANVESLTCCGSGSAKSGTSMASPHVAGAAAIFFKQWNTAEEVEIALFGQAARGKLSNLGERSPNLLLQVPPKCTASQIKGRLVLHTDGYSSVDTAVRITTGSTPILDRDIGSYENQAKEVMEFCFARGATYTLSVTDVYGDGLCCNYGQGKVELFLNGVLVFSDASAVPVVGNGNRPFGRSIGAGQQGSLVPLEYRFTAGFTPPPTPAPVPPTPAPVPPTAAPCVTASFVLKADAYSVIDNNFTIVRTNNNQKFLGRNIGFYNEGNRTYTDNVCLPAGSYVLTVEDLWPGDGLCCQRYQVGYSQGYFQFFLGGARQNVQNSWTGSGNFPSTAWQKVSFGFTV